MADSFQSNRQALKRLEVAIATALGNVDKAIADLREAVRLLTQQAEATDAFVQRGFVARLRWLLTGR